MAGCGSVRGLCFTKGASEIRGALESLTRAYEARVDAIVARASASSAASKRELFLMSFGQLADADGHAALASAELTIPALVSGDAAARAASSDAKKQLQHMWARAYARPDLYECLEGAEEGAQTAEEARLVHLVLGKFRQAGATLPSPEERDGASALDARSAALAFQIEQNINEDCTEVELGEGELAGLGRDFVESLPAVGGGAGARRCSIKAPVLAPIMQRGTCSEARRKLLGASQRRCMDANGPLLDELLAVRHRAAKALGFSSHAERMLSTKMAQTVPSAEGFCSEMLCRLRSLRGRELERLLARKRLDLAEARKRGRAGDDGPPEDEGCELAVWDTAFYSDMLKREELSFDDEKVKEFFPLVGTIERLLGIYSELLGLTFEKSDSLPRWHDEVVAFVVRRDSDTVGYLYLDQFPRDGKFGHQMIVPLAPSFVDSATGERCVPACVNISNLPRPQGDKPALLRFSEMKTLFHELGHAMHCLCTTTRFSLLSWAWPMVPWPGGVEQDFLEVPSMALEKFACEPVLLTRVAQHYSGHADAPTLGADTIASVQALERWMVGTSQSRFFAMALFDLKAHSQAPPYSLDGEEGLTAQQLYARLLEKHTGIRQLPGAHPCASWYHLVIGYDAGYYGYGWSDVYAADVFGAMCASPTGLLSPQTGALLRDQILGPCATRTGMEMLRSFLGREPSADAWCARNGIPAASAL